MYIWVLSFARGLHQVIELIRRMQMERIEKIVPWKHKIESRNDQDMELENFRQPSGLGCLAIAVAIEPGWLHPTPMPRTDSNPLSFYSCPNLRLSLFIFLSSFLCLVFYRHGTNQFTLLSIPEFTFTHIFWLSQNFASPMAFCGPLITHSLA